ncbi:uncharacterized protein LOC112163979 [Rosa chinensis]|uniref:uncharacterized protein LOC112163979 n=1 Tax=Rosa chinensis TaxID=74649 RepID=UPI000D08EF78|nr:uncharacterized protein LOC112163979 [Rosa chinensis]
MYSHMEGASWACAGGCAETKNRLQALPQLTLHVLINSVYTSSLTSSGKLLWRLVFCNLLWCLWVERNKLRFDGISFHFQRLKQFFILALRDFAALYFKPGIAFQSTLPIFIILGLSPLSTRAPIFIPVHWKRPPAPWLKVNTDGSFQDENHAGFGGVFRYCNGSFKGAYCSKALAKSVIEVELLAVIEAIQIAKARQWNNLWLETDSALVIHYFNSPLLIPWNLRVAWLNCLQTVKHFNFRISHVYREGNGVADRLASYGASHVGNIWWEALPDFIADIYGGDLISSVFYRVS